MSDPREPSRPERPVLNGLVALCAVALGVGLLLALVAVLGTRMAGLEEGDGSAAAESTERESMYLPTPAETSDDGGPLITLHTEDTDEPTGGSAAPEDGRTTESDKKKKQPKQRDISLQAQQNAVEAGERIYFSGVYPGGEGAILWVQRREGGRWADFAASVGVTNGTFSSYIFTGVTGLQRFRVIDRDTGNTSNEIRVRVG
ncbi:hypothetical protein [Nocardioides sp. SYSU DS0651]|uniref:hypothetical protein n=1 Tax=Nocardioides sp. SYSU DS0651 TaxID=3415955 RepID=UPI003F4BCE28